MRTFIIVGLVLWAACGSPSVTADAGGNESPDAGPADAGLTIRRDGGVVELSLGALPTTTVAGKDVVRLDRVVLEALPQASVGTLKVTFKGSDGFNPASRANCTMLVPVSGANLLKGGIEKATRNLVWDDSLGYPGCLYVRDLAELIVVDP